MTYPHQDRPRYSRAQIRAGRQMPIRPILDGLGHRFRPLTNGNYLLLGVAGDIVVKDNYWVCKNDGRAGNTIDFLIQVQGMTFSQTMNLLITSAGQPAPS